MLLWHFHRARAVALPLNAIFQATPVPPSWFLCVYCLRGTDMSQCSFFAPHRAGQNPSGPPFPRAHHACVISSKCSSL
ncbi:hypothetical protein EDD15DRAFT_2275185 [Pisolithus albus]|nr:hypothetical protein EDD15DRAFT_2275185 [Pisolithus albus]